MHKGELTIRVHDQEVTFFVFDYMKYPADLEECSNICIIDDMLNDKFRKDELSEELSNAKLTEYA